MAGQLPRHAPHGVHGARDRATQPQRGQQVGVAEEGVAGHHGALRNVTGVFYFMYYFLSLDTRYHYINHLRDDV